MNNREFKKSFYNRLKVFSLTIINFEKRLPPSVAVWDIFKQLSRSATSILANFAEGNDAMSRKEFIKFINIARKSAIETATWLDLLENLSPNQEFKREVRKSREESKEIRKILGSIIYSTQKK